MNRVQCVDVFRVPCSSPGDLRGVQTLIDQGALQASQIVAVMGKTEGNGCVNDHTRDFAATSWCHFLAPHLACSPAQVAERVALGEVPLARAEDAAVLSDWSLHSTHASASAGIELDHNVVIVLGEAAGAASRVRIGHTVMRDALDAASVRLLLREHFGIDPDSPVLQERLVNLLAKAEASPDGRVRGERHTMLNDSDIHATRHARAAVGAVLASVVGQTALYVSGGAEHQGPAGGGPVAAIVRVESTGAAHV